MLIEDLRLVRSCVMERHAIAVCETTEKILGMLNTQAGQLMMANDNYFDFGLGMIATSLLQ